jgi:hypothetical protein
MDLDLSVEQTVKARNSVRSYIEQSLSTKEKNQINAYISTLTNPFLIDVSFHLLEADTVANHTKLGTYGVIKGAKDYIGATVTEGELALEALGYSLEKLILYATSLGLGTCWLGGSFKRSEFAAAMAVKDNELFPAISPIGYRLGQKRMADTIVRKLAKSDKRKDWSEIFFKDDFSQPLDRADTWDYVFPLEMLRLAPSASNKQPWRIVCTDSGFHFYEAKTPGYGSLNGIDIQRIDIGIAACHFHLAALEKGLLGRFEKNYAPQIRTPQQIQYIFSWIIEC